MKRTILLITTVMTWVMVNALPAAAQNADMHNAPAANEAEEHEQPKDMRDDEMLAKSQPTDNGKVRYISGGIADSGMRTIDAKENHYNLKMLFVSKGEYLANVNVKITDSKGNSVLDTTTKGPLLLVKMPPGSYMVNTQTDSDATLKRHVKVSADHLASYVLRYPASEQ